MKAKCIRQPHNKSKNVINLSRSSNDHNNGDKQPISKIIQLTHKKPLKQRVNSNNNKRINATRNAKQQRNKFSL